MVSAVTAKVTALVTTVPSTASHISEMGLVTTIILIILLLTKELTTAVLDSLPPADYTIISIIDKVLKIGIIPLSMVFVFIMFFKIMSIL